MFRKWWMVVAGCTALALLWGCSSEVRRPEKRLSDVECVEQIRQDLEERANYQGYMGVVRMVPVIRNKQTGTIKPGITKDNGLMQARGDLAARISALVARQMQGTYNQVGLQDITDVEETLQRTLNTIAVRRLAYTEVLAEEYKCDYYGVALGMRNDDFRGL